jgi:hypothetical protein
MEYYLVARHGDVPELHGTARHELQEPLQPNAYSAADPAQRNPLQQQTFNQRSLLLRDEMVLWSKDKGTATEFATMVLFARVNVPVLLVPP